MTDTAPRVLGGLHFLRYLRFDSRATGPETGEATMPVEDDLCTEAAIRTGVLGLFLENATGAVALQTTRAVPSDIALTVVDGGRDAGMVHAQTRLVRLGRSMIVTDAHLRADDAGGRLLAYGSVNWVPVPDPDAATRPAHGTPPPVSYEDARVVRRPILDLMGVVVDGPRAELTTRLWEFSNGPLLHAGVMQMMTEAASLGAAGPLLGTGGLVVESLQIRFVTGATVGPFVATAEVLHARDSSVVCRVSMVDVGHDGRVVSLATTTTARR